MHTSSLRALRASVQAENNLPLLQYDVTALLVIDPAPETPLLRQQAGLTSNDTVFGEVSWAWAAWWSSGPLAQLKPGA